MEQLLTSDNAVIVLLAIYVIDLKRQTTAMQKTVEKQWAIVQRMWEGLAKIGKSLQVDVNKTGSFSRDDFA
jgi:hypothetical protein